VLTEPAWGWPHLTVEQWAFDSVDCTVTCGRLPAIQTYAKGGRYFSLNNLKCSFIRVASSGIAF